MKKLNFFWKGLLLLTCCLFVASVSFAQSNQWGHWCSRDYSSNGTFTVPNGCTKVWFEAVGGGGAGGFVKGYSAINPGDDENGRMYQVSGGGGGGAYGRTDINSGLVVGETFAITVGAGGYNTANAVSTTEYERECGWRAYVPLLYACVGRTYEGFWFVWRGSADDWWLLDDPHYVYPFFMNHRQDHGKTSSVYRNRTSSMILEAHGGKTCTGINSNSTGAAGGDTGGAGDVHYPGGKGGNATDRCGGALGDMSSGGGGGAGYPGSDGVNNAGGNGRCLMEDGGGAPGASSGIGGAGGEGTADWAADADRKPRRGQPGKNYGGGGAGGKVGTLNWSSGGDGAPGFVRVHFYIEAPALTVDLSANPTDLTGSGQTTQLTVTTNSQSQTASEGGAMFETTYEWNPSVPSNLKPTVNNTTQYCVTVTNTCIYAKESACKAVNHDCVTVTVNPVNPGSIAANNNNWVCKPGDTVVTITSTNPGNPTGGTYQWQYSTDNSTWSNVPDATGIEYTVVNTTGYYRRGYIYGSNSTQYTASVHVTRPSDIDPGTIKDNNNATQTSVCSGGNVNVNLTANTTYPVTWQTSTDGTNWTDWTDGVTPLTMNGLTQTTYVRYLAQYSTSSNPCYVPSNNFYTLNVWENPVVNSIAEPTDKCPGKTSYEVTADVTAGSNSTLTYHWKGATGSGNVGTVAATLPNCNTTYYDTLYVTDGNNCISNTKTNTFTTENPTWSLGTISSVTAVSDGSCNFAVPALTTLTDTLNKALNSTCGNAAVLSNLTPDEGDPITATTIVTATATDMCGVGHTVQITVVKPELPTVTVVPPSAYDYVLCPGETTTLSVITSAEEPVYAWTPTSLGTGATATTIAYTAEDIYVHADHYSVKVTDKYGCEVTGEIDIYTTPKAYIADQTHTICTPNSVTFAAATGDKIPEPSTTIGTYNFTSTTTYSWTIFSNTGVTGASAGTDQANFTTGTLTNGELTTQTVVYTVVPKTTTTLGGIEASSCEGDAFTVTVNVKPTITTAGAIDPFDDADVIITLWYGACDTLYYVNAPTYTNNTDLTDVLSNNKATVNEGTTLLGRIAPGEYTIRWTVTDECGNHVDFPKKYIVRYPNCGDADPNYTEPYYAVDADNNVYHTVRIGCECWTASNLKTVTGAPNSMVYKCNDYPNETENEEKYGRLYTWYTAVNVPEGDNTTEPTVSIAAYSTYPYVHGICPTGWAIPSTDNFNSMVNIAGGVNAVKSSSNLYWLPGAEGNDASGFGARGAGYYDSSAERFMNLMGETYFWTYETSSSYGGKCAVISYYCPELLIQDKLKGMGYSIRCIRRENP